MSHPFLTDQLANARLADLHAEADHRRAIRHVDARRGWRFWRRARSGPPPLPVLVLPQPAADAEADGTLRPVA